MNSEEPIGSVNIDASTEELEQAIRDAVVTLGMEERHPDLADNIIAVWKAEAEMGGVPNYKTGLRTALHRLGVTIEYGQRR